MTFVKWGNPTKKFRKANHTSLSDFTFQFVGYGHYRVTYTSPNTGRQWSAVIHDMQIIDATKNAEQPTQAALKSLKSRVKSGSI